MNDLTTALQNVDAGLIDKLNFIAYRKQSTLRDLVLNKLSEMVSVFEEREEITEIKIMRSKGPRL